MKHLRAALMLTTATVTRWALEQANARVWVRLHGDVA